MEWIGEHWIAVGLLTVYTGILLRNAYVGGQAKGMANYYVGGRNMGGVVVGISFFATFASTNSYIGHAGKGYEYGLPWMFMGFCLVLFTWISWRFVGPRLMRFARNFDALTIPDFLGSRFAATDTPRGTLRIAAAVVIVFSSLLYLVAIFKGAGHLLEQFLGVSYESAVAITLFIVVLYTSIGGFVSVVRTDVVQGVFMVLGAGLIFYFVSQASGGVMAIQELRVLPDKAFLFEWNGGIPFAVLLGISLSGALKLLVDPRQLSRFYALKDEREARLGIWVAVVGMVLVFGCLFPIGVYAHLILDQVTDTDLIVPMLVTDSAVFPRWAGDFLLVAIIAAAMSSMDSVLLVAASTLYRNLLSPFVAASKPVRWTRVAVIGFAVVSAGLALDPPGDIVELTIFSGSLYAVCFLPAVIFGLSRRFALHPPPGWIVGSMLAGSSVLVVWLASGLRSFVHEVFPALLVSALVFIAAGLMERKKTKTSTERTDSEGEQSVV